MVTTAAGLDAIGGRLAEQHPDTNRGWYITVAPLREEMARGSKTTLWLLMLAVLALDGHDRGGTGRDRRPARRAAPGYQSRMVHYRCAVAGRDGARFENDPLAVDARGAGARWSRPRRDWTRSAAGSQSSTRIPIEDGTLPLRRCGKRWREVRKRPSGC